MGKVNASGVAASLKSSFTGIKLALIVGICGGVPSAGADCKGGEIYLGDVIFSTALIQYDFGRQYPKELQTKDTTKDGLGRPNLKIRGVFTKLETTHYREQLQKTVAASLKKIQEKMPGAENPGSKADMLFEPSYLHKHHNSSTGSTVTCDQCIAGPEDICEDALKMTCEKLGCDESRMVDRHKAADVKASSEQHAVSVHFGAMGSGDTVMKSGQRRDRLAQDFGIIAFEMEGAGVWDHFPSIVVKGVCDYADSHKNKRWQSYAAATAAVGMKAFLKHWALEANDQEEPPPPVIWHVPFSQPGNFIGRKKVMAFLEDKLFQPHSHTPSRVALFGLGGMGKSRTAVELAYATRSRRPTYSVFWVQAMDHLTFEKDILEIGKKLNVPGIQGEKADVKNLVKQYLSQESAGNWLMILDNADDESIWGVPAKRGENGSENGPSPAESLPASATGRILVTTRSRQVALYMAGNSVIELLEMSEEEAVETFRGLLYEPESPMDAEWTSTLVQRLTCLPLAIVQAAAFISMNVTSTRRYLELLDDTEEEAIALLSKDLSNDEQRYRKGQTPVASTWLISFTQIQKQHPWAAELLAFTSCLGEKNIPSSLLPEAPSKTEMTEALGVLTGYSFLRKQNEDQDQSKEVLYQMHRLVRLATRNWLRREDTLLHWTEEAVGVVAEQFPWREHENRDQCALYMPHAEILRTSDGDGDSEEHYMLLEKMGWNFREDGKYSEAVQLLASVVGWRETKLGNSDIRDWSEAKIYLEKALAGYKEILGAEHAYTLWCMAVLVETYNRLENWEIAEELGEQVTRMRKEVLGAEHPATLESMADLVWIFYRKEQYQKAEELGLRVMETRLKVLKEEHPDTLKSMGELATIYRELGRLEEAEELDTKVFQIEVRILGPEHPDTLTTMKNLALIYKDQGRLEEAENLELEALETSARILGSEHPVRSHVGRYHRNRATPEQRQKLLKSRAKESPHEQQKPWETGPRWSLGKLSYRPSAPPGTNRPEPTGQMLPAAPTKAETLTSQQTRDGRHTKCNHPTQHDKDRDVQDVIHDQEDRALLVVPLSPDELYADYQQLCRVPLQGVDVVDPFRSSILSDHPNSFMLLRFYQDWASTPRHHIDQDLHNELVLMPLLAYNATIMTSLNLTSRHESGLHNFTGRSLHLVQQSLKKLSASQVPIIANALAFLIMCALFQADHNAAQTHLQGLKALLFHSGCSLRSLPLHVQRMVGYCDIAARLPQLGRPIFDSEFQSPSIGQMSVVGDSPFELAREYLSGLFARLGEETYCQIKDAVTNVLNTLEEVVSLDFRTAEDPSALQFMYYRTYISLLDLEEIPSDGNRRLQSCRAQLVRAFWNIALLAPIRQEHGELFKQAVQRLESICRNAQGPMDCGPQELSRSALPHNISTGMLRDLSDQYPRFVGRDAPSRMNDLVVGYAEVHARLSEYKQASRDNISLSLRRRLYGPIFLHNPVTPQT
ncbi:hypothetical protein LTR72_004264 [Exophiala xenobiotica]|nr:hypothetical protein LTR72_004264 [Exophiala xenobiotica]KAK5473857.1 hypothetical protein LTR55_010149 [Exophiala xenobiotica]